MKFKWPIQTLSVSIADDLQRCLGWSTALAAPQPATSVTLLLAILEAGGLTHGSDLERALRQATNLAFVDRRSVLTTDHLFLALLTQDSPARDTLVSLGKDPSEMRTEVMRSRPAPG
jgi:hypothetical protein